MIFNEDLILDRRYKLAVPKEAGTLISVTSLIGGSTLVTIDVVETLLVHSTRNPIRTETK